LYSIQDRGVAVKCCFPLGGKAILRILRLNIAKFHPIVILALLCAVTSSCVSFRRPPAPEPAKVSYDSPVTVGSISLREIDEASGIAASRCQPNVYWTHNDSGDGPFIFAITETGENLGVWRVPTAKNYDWEDIAVFRDANGRCFLYIGDIGNNKGLRRSHTIYIVPEPIVDSSAARSRDSAGHTAAPEPVSYKYPDGVENAEALIVHPIDGSVYVITKSYTAPAKLYQIPMKSDENDSIAKFIGQINLPAIPPGTVTGADISPDGRRLIISDYGSGYEFLLDLSTTEIGDIASQTPERIDIGSREIGEGVAYSADGESIIAISEGVGSPIWITKRKK
jgi:hypothetical protein